MPLTVLLSPAHTRGREESFRRQMHCRLNDLESFYERQVNYGVVKLNTTDHALGPYGPLTRTRQ